MTSPRESEEPTRIGPGTSMGAREQAPPFPIMEATLLPEAEIAI